MSLFLNQEDGYTSLTPAGYGASIVLLLVVFFAGLAFLNSKTKMTARQIAYSAVSIALAFLLSYITILQMPWGGAVTLLSMFFVCFVGYLFGPVVGITSAFAFGMLQFLQSGGSYILSPLQVCLDYLFAFTALGVSGFFYRKKNGLLIGYIVGALLRGLMHTIGGYLFWMDYMPENFPRSLTAVYPILYNYAYILPEMILTIVVVSLPPVKKAIAHVKQMAVPEGLRSTASAESAA